MLFALGPLGAVIAGGLLGQAAAGDGDAAGERSGGVVLHEKTTAGEQRHVTLALLVQGSQGNPKDPRPLVARAELKYPERVLEVGPDGMPAKVLRVYKGARASFTVDGETRERSLRQPVRTAVVERQNNLPANWSPNGPFTVDERELVDDVLDTTRVTGLLPHQPVRQGSTWKLEPTVAQALCNLEAYISSDLRVAVEELTDAKATLKVTGHAHGLSYGVEIKLKVDAVLTYNVATQFAQRLVWTQQDERSLGPVSERGKYTIKITVDRERAQSPELTEQAITNVRTKGTADDFGLLYESPNGVYNFIHDRPWHVVDVQDKLAVLRMVKGNEFLAQLTVNTVTEKSSHAKVSLDELLQIISASGPWNFKDGEAIVEVPTAGGMVIQMVKGYNVQQLPTPPGAKEPPPPRKIEQRHYLVTSAAGRQLLFSFLVDEKNREKLGDDDQRLVATVEFPQPKPAAPRTADKGDERPTK